MVFDPVLGKGYFFEIVCISLISAVVSEAVSWLLIYRKPHYVALVDNLEKEQKKLDKWKDGEESGNRGRSDKSKKIKSKDARVKELHRELQVIKMSSQMVMAVSMIGVFSVLSSIYDAKVVAKLPFIPVSFVQGLSHRNLPGDDMTDASYIFLYAISSMAIKSNLMKALGFTPPQPPAGQNPFFDMPDMDAEREKWR